MNVVATVAGLLVMLVAVLPGLLGDRAYRALAGVSWREKEFQQLLRLLAFSAFGLAGYTFLASRRLWPLPEYVVPSTYANGAFQVQALPSLAIAYIGHWVGAAIVGTIAGVVVVGLRRLGTGLGERDAWDHFIHSAVPRHWVVIRTESGESYAGFIERADVSVEPNFRDIILKEPYIWNDGTKTYQPTYQQALFLQGTKVASVAVIHDPVQDSRIVQIGEVPFKGVGDAKPTKADEPID